MGTLILTFEWDGETVHKETRGFKGRECIFKTEFVEKALGIAGSRQLKGEYYAETEEIGQEKTKVRNGHQPYF